jgi:catalase
MPVGTDGDYFSQPGNLFRLIAPAQRKALFENTARSAPRPGKSRFATYAIVGKGVGDALGIPVTDIPKS